MIQPAAGAPAPSPEAPALEARRLRVRHLTRFTYHGPSTDSFNDVRLQPVSDSLQHCTSFELRIDPPAAVRAYEDAFGNRVHFFEIGRPHEALAIEAVSVVDTRPDPRLRPPVRPLAALDDPVLTPEGWFEYAVDSTYVPLDGRLAEEARAVLGGPVGDLWADALRLAAHVHATVDYVPHATSVTTRALEVLTQRRGVCQDFAHLLLGLCRASGLPARYVSGYFHNLRRRPGEVEASHAWVEILVPGHGWRGYDPTHHREVDPRYVKLAVGRDYADIRPVSGTFRGRGTRAMTVEVQVEAA